MRRLPGQDARYHFTLRIAAERVSMGHVGRIVTSSRQERREQHGHQAYRGAVNVANDHRFVVIPPGVNRCVFSPEPVPPDEAVRQPIEAASACDVADSRQGLPLVICSGRLGRKKNHSI